MKIDVELFKFSPGPNFIDYIDPVCVHIAVSWDKENTWGGNFTFLNQSQTCLVILIELYDTVRFYIH